MPGSGKVVYSRDPDILEELANPFCAGRGSREADERLRARDRGLGSSDGLLHLEQHRDTAETAAPSLLDELEPTAEVGGKDRRRTPSECRADSTLVAWVDLERAER